jgi:hypothetical protein
MLEKRNLEVLSWKHPTPPRRGFIIKQVLFLRERLPAAIISWQDATPTEISFTYLKARSWKEELNFESC